MKQNILTGAESFEKLIEGEYFYIDKTLFIKELHENRGDVTLITRPRRFGKTLNLSMLRSFFDITKDSKTYFTGLKIVEHQEIVEKYMNNYPVIFLTLKDIHENSFEEAIEETRSLVSYIYRQNIYLYERDRLNDQQKKLYYSFLAGESTINDLKSSLKFFTECLYTYHKKRVIVLMDEYDAPLDCANKNGYYKEMIGFMRGFMGRVFKSNDSLEFAVLTGVLRIARESLFSSFNNPKICGIMDKPFSTIFGFTEDEVKHACDFFEISENYPEVKKWYDGYRIGGQDMYNPWSITRYLDSKVFENFWVNTGSIDVFKEMFEKGNAKLKDDVAGLLTGKPITMSFVDSFTYPIEFEKANSFWSLLMSAGYLKPCNGAKTETFAAELVNKEIHNIFSFYAQEWLKYKQTSISQSIQDFVECLLKGDAQGVQTILNEELLNNPSCHDFKTENSYHMFIFGILLAVNKNYLVYSNHESGKGRSDCLIKPDNKDDYAVVIEFKHCKFRPPLQEEIKEGSINLIKEEAQKGLQQINEKAYIHTLKNEGYQKIYKYSIAFYQKNCEVLLEL